MRSSKYKISVLTLIWTTFPLILTSCGVKGPPLPPIDTTPQHSERKTGSDRLPHPSSSQSPTPSTDQEHSK